MKCYSLPIDINELKSVDPKDSIIDMSKLNFPCSPDKQKRSAFLFIRNTDLQIPTFYTNCSYEGKCEYLMSYYTGNLTVHIPDLDKEWLSLLMRRVHRRQPSYGMFTNEDADRFIREHKDFIDEVLQLIISLPLCAMEYFLSDKENVDTDISIDTFPKSNWDKLNINNFIHLLDFEEILTLISPIDDLRPTFYTKYFFQDGNPYMGKMIVGLPFLGLLNAMMYNAGDQTFANQLNTILNKEVTGNND